MNSIFEEVWHFFYAGGWIGLLALLSGIVAGILALRGTRKGRPALVNWGLVFSILAFVIGFLGMFGDMTKVEKYVSTKVEQGASADVADSIRQYGNMESSVSLYWGIVGLMPGLWLWLAGRGKRRAGA